MNTFQLTPLFVAVVAATVSMSGAQTIAADDTNQPKKEKPTVERIIKIDPQLIEMAQSQQSLPVIIVLSDQSHRADIKKIRAQHEAKIDAARRAGCDQVLTRGQFQSQMSSFIS